MKLDKLIITFVVVMTMSLSASAEPNYTYVTVQPGDYYINTTDKPQQVRVRNQDDLTGYEKTRDTMYKTTNALNDVVNNVRAITTMFGYNFGY